METIIKGVHNFIEIIDELSYSYHTYGFFDVPVHPKFVFRGVGKKSYPLLPNILRNHVTNIHGMEIPNRKYTAWATEKSILKNFIAEASGIVNSIPYSDLYRWAEYAQHYGAPTRFMDWTGNPLVALFFACCAKGEENPAVWVLNISNYQIFAEQNNMETIDKDTINTMTSSEIINQMLDNKHILNYPIIYQPHYVDTRMSAQSSYFMVWGNKCEALDEMIPEENYMQLSNADSNRGRTFRKMQEQGIILKIEIYNDRKQEILRTLDIMGINDKTLFPGLDGIGKYIERKYRFDYNEAVERL